MTPYSSTVRTAADMSTQLPHACDFLDSGHGGQSKDASGKESDGLDEVIFPLDFEREGDIIDDVRILSLSLLPVLMFEFRNCTTPL